MDGELNKIAEYRGECKFLNQQQLQGGQPMARGVGGASPAKITQHLSGIDFPATKQNLIEHAQQNNADREIIDVLEQMPEREYQSMADVMKGFGEVE